MEAYRAITVTSIEERKVRGRIPFSRIGAHSTRYHTQRITNKITVENGSNLSLAALSIRSDPDYRAEGKGALARSVGEAFAFLHQKSEPLESTELHAGPSQKGFFWEG